MLDWLRPHKSKAVENAKARARERARERVSEPPTLPPAEGLVVEELSAEAFARLFGDRNQAA